MSIGSRLAHAWNAFTNGDTAPQRAFNSGASYGVRPDRVRFNFSNERSIISSIYTRIAIDVASIDIRHVRLDDGGRYLDDMDSGLQNCLAVEANIDQDFLAFKRDLVMSLCDRGAVAAVPVDTSLNPLETGGYDVLTLRVGYVTEWYPQSVRVNLYNDQTGRREEVTLPKSMCALVENPLYPVMNEPNSTLQRLIRKLNLLDAIDEQSASGKLDLIIQLPYVVKSETMRQRADQRRKDIEFQLKGSQYGIAYTDGTEKITQLNRPAENNLMAQIEYLTTMLYSQLGLTPAIMDGSADEKVILNYLNRTVEPIASAVVAEFKRKFLTKTARSQKQSVMAFRDPFKLVPLADFAEIADKLTRNEIATANEIRQIVGLKPSKDPKADMLINSNMPQPNPALPAGPTTDASAAPADPTSETTGSSAPASAADASSIMDSSFDEIDKALDGVFSGLGVDPNDSTG